MAVTVPVASTVVVTHAVPEASSTVVSFSPPGPVKVTVPVGVPEPGGSMVTVAHTSTDSPHTDGSGLTVTTVVVDASSTVTSVLPDETAAQPSPL
ncbi:hypothetical protein AN217_12910 [Streptomyces qinglanensis]|uniref:Uncharacterized protein n=1 Tax=Streptomyces qinglanensis TaxID=943816 RepID=A0A1E7K3V5_9ACTN|nr:hypothetical protein AN217_12870 [Streptomyces qinglanensis]OEU98560.1 hypothetical protein AN217_12875 [Streptomyces qinglanensis]OEU98562.1 hypothetical protein AN217_12885 [Streptomyces qinglanensis]OEU98563.1 hypothetical protein AN217_12890 [Streptomyces qinglanensis]OEU98564.1 hypothetical protein AN217_12895 [Streptomyces qinglanensis]